MKGGEGGGEGGERLLKLCCLDVVVEGDWVGGGWESSSVRDSRPELSRAAIGIGILVLVLYLFAD